MRRLPVMALTALLSRYDQVILDLDGCVWIGPEPIPGSVDAINAIREAGLKLAFVTNNSWYSGEDQVAKLWGMGVQASLADVVTVGGAMQHLLAETRQGHTAFVLGSEPMFRHVKDAGLRILNGTDLASRAEVVVVSATLELTYDDLKNAALAARRSGDLLATPYSLPPCPARPTTSIPPPRATGDCSMASRRSTAFIAWPPAASSRAWGPVGR